MMERDFTLRKYAELCNTLLDSEYQILTVLSCLENNKKIEKFAILRHDVDVSAEKALVIAGLERSLGLKSTYYFRYPRTFHPEIIKRISSMGHEVGYHYEVLDKTKGNPEEAIQLFENELEEFRKICDVKTICMHENPLSKHIDLNLWGEYDFRDYGILGEAYLSLDYNDVFYFSDTGRTWGAKYKIKDFVDIQNEYSTVVSKTDDLINLVKEQKLDKLCLLTHPKRWNDEYTAWLHELIFQNIRNIPKVVISWF